MIFIPSLSAAKKPTPTPCSGPLAVFESTEGSIEFIDDSGNVTVSTVTPTITLFQPCDTSTGKYHTDLYYGTFTYTDPAGNGVSEAFSAIPAPPAISQIYEIDGIRGTTGATQGVHGQGYFGAFMNPSTGKRQHGFAVGGAIDDTKASTSWGGGFQAVFFQ